MHCHPALLGINAEPMLAGTELIEGAALHVLEVIFSM